MVTVAVTKITVSSTDVKLRAAVSVVDPFVGVSVQIPVSEIAYIYLQVVASLDSTGRFKFIADSVTLNDGSVRSFAKARADSFSLIDVAEKTLTKPFADSIVLSDLLLKTLTFIRSFADTQSISDGAIRAIAKQSTDSVLMSDSLSRVFSKSITETVAIAELASRSVAKFLVDTVSLGDDKYLSSQKNFVEVQSIADATVINIIKLLAESAIPVDTIALNISKNLTDGFAMNDSAEAADGLTFTFSIGVQNVIFVSDSDARSFQKPRTDSVSMSDSGFLLQQDYCDLTYFAEDYVGVGFSF